MSIMTFSPGLSAPTAASQTRVEALLAEAGIRAPTPLCFESPTVTSAQLSAEDEPSVVRSLLARMRRPEAAEYDGFFLFDIGRALADEARLTEAIQDAVGDLPYRNMAAFKANHSPVLQAARLQRDPDAGLEVASLTEVTTACCLGIRPENIVYANPNVNAREFLASYRLGVTAFAVDHLDKLHRIARVVTSHGLDPQRLRLLLRIAAPYASAAVSMERFGLDVEKNPNELRAVLELAAQSSMPIAGVAFHVGLGARSTVAYENVFDRVAQVLELAREVSPVPPGIINVGGGFGFDPRAHRFLGTLSVSEQIDEIRRGVRRLQREFPWPLQVWSEIGQGSVGNAGSLFARVDFHERRENPELALRVSTPTLPGSFQWSQASKKIYADTEQWLVTPTGYWSLGVTRYTTIQPEVWAVQRDGRADRLDASEKDLVPTMVFGKSCDPSDALNPWVNGEAVRFLMPDLRRFSADFFALRLRSGAYMDTAGDFNGQTSRSLPWHYRLPEEGAERPSRPKSPAVQGTADEWQYRDRILSHNIVTAEQIQAAKELIAHQFLEHEQMISWLRQTGQLVTERELEALRYELWRGVEACVDSGLSMVRLKVRRGQSEAEGEVVAALAAKAIGASDVPPLPANQARDWERRTSRLFFELEALLLRRAQRLSGGLRDKIFPTAYLAMTAKKRGEGEPACRLREKVLDLARGRDDIKSVTSMTTGARSCRVAEQVEGSFRMFVAPYDEITLYGRRPFAGIQFRDHAGEKPGELRFYAHDLRGPHRFKEPLPVEERLSLDLRDRANHPE